MKLPEPFRFFLDSTLDIARLNQNLLAGFQLLQDSISEMDEACVLDTFDHPLRLSDRLLLQYQSNLLLFGRNVYPDLMQPCPDQWCFVSDLPDGPVKEELREISSLRAFLPVCSADLQTGRLLLLDDEEKTQARMHFYTFERDNQTKTFGNTQALQGYTKGHRILVDALIKQRVQSRKTVSDLYLFLGVGNQSYCSKPSIPLNPETTASETTRSIISTYIQVARQNEAGIQADYDTEFLHDYRVSLRKVRSVLSLFKGVFSEDDTNRLKHMFADMMKQTNRLRDLDVYLLDKELYFSMVPEMMHKGLDLMFQVFAKERQQQLTSVVDMLNSSIYEQRSRDLVEQFKTADTLKSGSKGDDPTLPFARKLIWKRYNKVCKIARHINADTPDENVHRLRIQCKKLRYLMEFFAPLFPKKMTKTLIKSLKRLQDNLGRFNDFSVQQISLQRFLQEHSQHQSSLKLAESIGALIAVLHQRQVAERHQLMNNVAYFDSIETRTAFRTLFTREKKQ